MSTTKIDLKRELRDYYTARRTPHLVEVPELQFIMIDGHGDPNTTPEYGEAVQALYATAYAARFALKRAGADYAVMPLEGLWWVPDMTAFTVTDKSAWDWTMMIMQPAEVTPEVFEAARETAAKKGTNAEALGRARLERFAEGLSAQMLYLGAYADEGPSITALHEYIAEQGYGLSGKHHEIYLGDPRRTAPDKLKTILRQPVSH